MEKTVIHVARDFTRYPAGRYVTDGKWSGQRFRDEYLKPAIEAGEVEVNLDGTAGFGSSFLEEAFGGLARLKIISLDEMLKRIKLISRDSSLVQEIREYIVSAYDH